MSLKVLDALSLMAHRGSSPLKGKTTERRARASQFKGKIMSVTCEGCRAPVEHPQEHLGGVRFVCGLCAAASGFPRGMGKDGSCSFYEGKKGDAFARRVVDHRSAASSRRLRASTELHKAKDVPHACAGCGCDVFHSLAALENRVACVACAKATPGLDHIRGTGRDGAVLLHDSRTIVDHRTRTIIDHRTEKEFILPRSTVDAAKYGWHTSLSPSLGIEPCSACGAAPCDCHEKIWNYAYRTSPSEWNWNFERPVARAYAVETKGPELELDDEKRGPIQRMRDGLPCRDCGAVKCDCNEEIWNVPVCVDGQWLWYLGVGRTVTLPRSEAKWGQEIALKNHSFQRNDFLVGSVRRVRDGLPTSRPSSAKFYPSVKQSRVARSCGEATLVFDAVKAAFSEKVQDIQIYVHRVVDPASLSESSIGYRPFPMAPIEDGAGLYDYILRNIHKTSEAAEYKVYFREPNGAERGRGHARMPTVPEVLPLRKLAEPHYILPGEPIGMFLHVPPCPICERIDHVCLVDNNHVTCGKPAPFFAGKNPMCAGHMYDFKEMMSVVCSPDLCDECNGALQRAFRPAVYALAVKKKADRYDNSYVFEEARNIHKLCDVEWMKYALRKRALVPR